MKDIKSFIIYLSSSMHVARLSQSRSKTLRMHTGKTHEILSELFKDLSSVKLSLRGNQLFLNGERIEVGMEIMGRYRALIQDLKYLSIGSIIFTKLPEVREITSFVYIIGKTLSSNIVSFDRLTRRMEELGVKSIKIELLEEAEEIKEGMARTLRKEAVKNLLGGISYLKNVAQDSNEDVNVARRLVRKFSELVLKDPGYLLSLTTVKNIGSYTLNHSVNVCILSLAMGMELGLSRRDLIELGIAALFHDLGKFDIPGEILDKPDKLTNLEYEKMKQHPYLSAERILFLGGMDEIPIFAVRGILEHHIDFNGRGYPDIGVKKPSLFARLIRIVDSYDAMTTPRLYQPVTTPFEALKNIVLSPEVYDPSLVKVFLNLMGIYPPGTVVRLKNGLIGVIVSRGFVAVVDKGDLVEKEEKEVLIEKAISPEDVDVDPASVIAALGSYEGTSGI
ncbi:HD domain-containing protein [candidate division WOR-3 bacterium]|nr:HD domain-containing protein [candidate division WOR-3 bacterium]